MARRCCRPPRALRDRRLPRSNPARRGHDRG